MDYEKAYKAVLKTATQWIKDGCTDKEKICLECVFPELRESEDERIRKNLMRMVQNVRNDSTEEGYYDIPFDKYLAYLEKQKEQKPISQEDFDTAKHEALWEKQKPAEKIAFTPIDTELTEFEKAVVKLCQIGKDEYPCYEFAKKYSPSLLDLAKKEFEQPAEWSEEDEEVMEDLYNFVISNFIQDHIHEARWKPWKTTLERNRQNRLKSLRPQPSWKPSEEDLLMLEHIIEQYETGNKNSKVMGYLPRVEELDFLKKVFAKWKN